jgi:hypothetical protein
VKTYLKLRFIIDSVHGIFQQDKGLLYEISGNELAKSSYVFERFTSCAEDYHVWNYKTEVCHRTSSFELDMDDP